MRFRVLLFIWIGTSLQLVAQESWTLNDCIKYALKNNLQLQEVGMSADLAALDYSQSRWNLLPFHQCRIRCRQELWPVG